MQNDINGIVADKPSEIVVSYFHAHDGHTFSDFGLFLLEHERCLPQVYQ
jgi:hypothetical protein